jgi:3-methyladenine DNA glycosylase Tag
MAQTYCDAAPGHEWHGPYHDREYGFPLEGDAELFERRVYQLILERRPPWSSEQSVMSEP